jgi:hypothetical protein
MNQWTRARWWSFGIHVAFVSIPFVASSASALLFWHTLFGSWWLAVPMVAIIDVLALTGLVLYIAGIPSPFVPLRHVLPFVSVVPLGVELYGALSHNDGVTAVIVTVIVVAIMVTVAWQCFRTIERLFVSPVTAAREKAREQLTALTVGMAQLMEQNSVVAEFVTAWQGQAVTATITDTPVALSEGESKTARVKALADQYGVSMSTAWRKVKAGEWNVEEIN